MTERECVSLLRWAIPQLGLRWQGFRKFHRQVCRRVQRRARELGVDLSGYRSRLERDPAEMALFATFCRVTISRFWRDRGLWERLRDVELPRMRAPVRALSAGCASGEEPYSLALLWNFSFRGPIEIVAFDSDDEVLERAREGEYPSSSLAELPVAMRDAGFERRGEIFRLRDEHRIVRFEKRDLRRELPAGPFDLVFCRNVAFTYFDVAGQLEVARRLAERMRPGAVLALGRHEKLPAGAPFVLEDRGASLYRAGILGA